MGILDFLGGKKKDAGDAPAVDLRPVLDGYSLEVMPRTATKVEDFPALVPAKTRIYIAHIEGTPIEEMLATAKRLHEDGFKVMPHFPARIIKDQATLEDWIKRYRDEADIRQALLLAGGVDKPHGDYHSSMQLLETGLFDKYGFERLHVAGHPEGNKDIDADGSSANVDAAAKWKQDFSQRTDAEMAMVTQFAFDMAPVIEWADRLKAEGVDLPIHVGVAGPAKLQTLIKYAIACGVGPSLKVLQKRAADVSKLMVPYEPTEVLEQLSAHKQAKPDSNLASVHFFPLGGIKTNVTWANEHGGAQPMRVG
ncbi:methylenetetrahydrofolate reductase [Mesobaculum littorinae]|uniref:Methylenetetrahydrofolate reductase n=1 Tax=Mesobaculum littorinae TaxID=2486419 RepID=A0A438AGR3_9RHOB|nr:methylenetetrahydrofolate reductase [Mesobaculum littorinae]RVV97884.1 methylenetetrahydrofolate reductase [Mesobaculum littorinae]